MSRVRGSRPPRSPQAPGEAPRTSRATVRVVLGAALIAAASALGGCDELEIRPFPEGQGQNPEASGGPYPAGPYGLGKGSVIANYRFEGLANPEVDAQTFVELRFSDFYNPTGDGVFAADSPYGERPKPRVLWLTVGAVWCGPCQYEAENVLPEEHAVYAPRGAEIFAVLADGPTVGKPATAAHLANWVSRYETAWPAAIDPTYKFAAQFDADGLPANMVIDTSTMQIVESINGAPQAGSIFFVTLDALLGPPG